MSDFRSFVAELDRTGELLVVSRSVNPRFELAALLKQAEERRKAILFRAVQGSPFAVAGGLFTSPLRFARSLGLTTEVEFSTKDHAALMASALRTPLTTTLVSEAPVQAERLDVDKLCGLPVPTFFAEDSGAFLTGAVGISRSPDDGPVNAGFYRVLQLDNGTLGISVSPASDLYGFIVAARARAAKLPMVLAVGAPPALLMAAAAKVPAEVSELDVAGALQGEPLEVVTALNSGLPVPASSEFCIEIVVDPAESFPNTMGEYGDMYGAQAAFRAHVTAITHRTEPLFHAIMAGAGKEHNTIGMIVLYGVEPELRSWLTERCPDFADVRLRFEPPAMGSRGDIYIQLRGGRNEDADALIRDVYARVCGNLPLTRLARRVVLLDPDIDLGRSAQVEWAIATRAVAADDYYLFEEAQLADGKPSSPLRIGIDARARQGEGMQRLVIPGETEVRLDDYLDD